MHFSVKIDSYSMSIDTDSYYQQYVDAANKLIKELEIKKASWEQEIANQAESLEREMKG